VQLGHVLEAGTEFDPRCRVLMSDFRDELYAWLSRYPDVQLLLTITTAPCTERAGCTDGTENRTDSTGRAGIPGDPVHDPVHAVPDAVITESNRAWKPGPAAAAGPGFSVVTHCQRRTQDDTGDRRIAG
jgi:hypothetical protein